MSYTCQGVPTAPHIIPPYRKCLCFLSSCTFGVLIGSFDHCLNHNIAQKSEIHTIISTPWGAPILEPFNFGLLTTNHPACHDWKSQLTCTTRSDSWAEAYKGIWFWASTVIVAPEEFLRFTMFWPDVPIIPPAWEPAIKSLIVFEATCPAPTLRASRLPSSSYENNHFISHQIQHKKFNC